MTTLLMYWPLAPVGLAFTTASIRAVRLSIKLLRREADLANRHVQVSGLVQAELNPPEAQLLDQPSQVLRGADRAGFRAGHQAAGTQYLAQATHLAHDLGRRDSDIEIQPAALNLLNEFVTPDVVGACVLGQSGRLASAKTRIRTFLPVPLGRRTTLADLLISVPWVHTHLHVNFDRAVKLGI